MKKDGISYTLNKETNTYAVMGYDGQSQKIVIPSKIRGLPVTSIRSQAFSGCDALATATFANPNGWMQKGKSVDMTDPTTAAQELKYASSLSRN